MKEEIIAQFESLISQVVDHQYGICEDFLDQELLAGLRKNLLTHHSQGAMHPAGVGRNFDFHKNLKVRGDVIRWMEEGKEDRFEKLFWDKVHHFSDYLNRTSFTGINQSEFHYAWYAKGSFYQRHLDQFKSHRGRRFSLVIYLNEDWEKADGGNLRLYLDDRVEDVYPQGGRAVFFRSDEVEHEVMASPVRSRMSIAGWLKSV